MTIRIDKDVRQMTMSQLRHEVMRLRLAFRKEIAHRGNHRCWVTLLAALPEGESIKPLALSRDEFLKNCRRYFERNQ